MAAFFPRPKLREGKWAPPPKDFVKVNIDASFDEDNLGGTTGIIIRDSKGRFVAARNSKNRQRFMMLFLQKQWL